MQRRKTQRRHNVVQARSFAEMLEKSINAYHKRAITTQEVINELIGIAKEVRDAQARGEALGLSTDEVAFYDALADNGSAKEVMGDEKLAFIARELVGKIRKNVTIDWAVRQTARAKMRVLVKRILKHFGYPPDLEKKAIQTVLEQAELLCSDRIAL